MAAAPSGVIAWRGLKGWPYLAAVTLTRRARWTPTPDATIPTAVLSFAEPQAPSEPRRWQVRWEAGP